MTIRNASRQQKTTQSENKINTKVISIALSIILFLILIWDITSPYGLWKYYHLRREKDIIFNANVQLDKKNQKLKDTIAMLKSNPKFQEKWIRKNLGWVKSNELLFVFISRDSN